MNRGRSTLIISVTFLFAAFGIAAELPRNSMELIEKWEEFEKSEKEKLESLLTEKKKAVVELLQKQAADETQKGNLDGALAIQEKIVELGGESAATEMPVATNQPAASWEVPDDAILYRGDYYKIYPLAAPVTWDEARARCRAVGGEIGWLDRKSDEEELRKWMQPLVNAKGHAPIWMGAQKNDSGEWQWINGKPVDKDLWDDDTLNANPTHTKMIRWIAGFSATAPDSTRNFIGYLCRWKR